MVAKRIRQGEKCLQHETIVARWQTASMQLSIAKIPSSQMEILSDKLSNRQTILCKVRLSYASVFLTFLLPIHSTSQSL